MGQNGFDEQVKSRIPSDVKRRLEILAKERELDLSDLVREALREYLARRPDGQGELTLVEGKRGGS